MRIGLLNEILTPTLRFYKADGTVPEPKVEGNPLQGEPLLVRWQDLMEEPLYLAVDLGEHAFVSDICLALGEQSAPHTITVWDAERRHVLCRHVAETNGVIHPQTLSLTLAQDLQGFVIEIESYFASVDLTELKIYGATQDGPMLFPTPCSMTLAEGAFPVASLCTYRADSADAQAAVAVFAQKLAEVSGVTLQQADDGALRLVTDTSLAENAYRLCVSPDGVLLCAADLRGFVYGTENLLKLLCDGAFPCCEVNDSPRLPFRGVHLMLPGPEEMEFARRLIKYVISPMGYNAVILEIAGGMRFDSHPEITEAVLHAKQMAREGKWPKYPHASVGGKGCTEKHEVAAFADYIRSFGIDVIPEVQSLGHVQFLTLAHPEIAERGDEEESAKVDELVADVPPKKFYAHCYCPSNERSYEITMDLLDEIIEVVRPTKYVHMGHDEVYQIGVCPKCREKDPADLFAADVCRYHAHLAEKGLRMMIWSDMLQPVTRYQTPPAVHKIPRDVVMLDFIWYFHMDKDIEDNLLPHGFRLAYGNLYSSHFPRYESRIAKDGVIGGQISAWVSTSEYALGKEGKLYDFLYTAQMLWSADYDSHLRWVYDKTLKSMIPAIRAALRAQKPLEGEQSVLLARRTPLEERVTQLEINAECDALLFEHATARKLTRIAWAPLDTIGCYRVTYCDGSVLEIPLEYGGNIGYYARRQNEPLKGSYYRHNGYFSTYFTDGIESRAEDGSPVTLYRYEWRNPEPAKKILSIALCEADDAHAQVCLCGLVAVNKRDN